MGLLDPVSEGSEADRQSLAPRVDSLEGKRIGLLGNGKQAAEPVLNVVEEMLDDRYDDVDIDYYLVGELNLLKDDAELADIEEWAAGTDCVITAIGDCGSCTKFLAWATDSVEDAGVPGVGLIDAGFELDWKSSAIERGRPLRYEKIPVRCEITDRERIREEMTDEVLDAVAEKLTRPLSADERAEPAAAD